MRFFDKGPPRAAVGSFPYPRHRNMQEVIDDREQWNKAYQKERSSWKNGL